MKEDPGVNFDKEEFYKNPEIPPISDEDREKIRKRTGVANPKLQEDIWEMIVEGQIATAQSISDQMPTKMKQAVRIERDRMVQYFEEHIILKAATQQVSIPIHLLRRLLSGIRNAAHHQTRSMNQFVLMEEDCPILPVERSVLNRVVCDGEDRL